MIERSYLEIANNTEYGLTGAVFSKNESHLEQAVLDFHVGNVRALLTNARKSH
jgi:acyl-CoA reductase-like NAD-dependent aldehyde dehydrogenase